MKAERQQPPFVPVTMTLESQAEVDGLYAFLRHQVSDVFEFSPDAGIALEPFVTDTARIWAKYTDRFDEAYRNHSSQPPA